MMRFLRSIAVVMGLASSLPLPSQPAHAADISIVGSSTVYPFMLHVATVFGRRVGKQIALEPTGTESGFDYFCAGTADYLPAINNASVAMTREQFRDCQRNGVRDILAFQIGFDGIVVFSDIDSPLDDLGLDELYRALAGEISNAGSFTPNSSRLWSEIDSTLAAEPIRIFGPPSTSGTRVFIEREILRLVCERRLGRRLFSVREQDRCGAVRDDGPYVDVSEDDRFLINAVVQSSHSVGIVGYGNFQSASQGLKALSIDGIKPTYDAIRSTRYPLSRPLFVYVKMASLRRNPQIGELLTLLISDEMTGTNGALAKLGLISPSPDTIAQNRSTLANRTPLECPSAFCAQTPTP